MRTSRSRSIEKPPTSIARRRAVSIVFAAALKRELLWPAVAGRACASAAVTAASSCSESGSGGFETPYALGFAWLR